MGDYARDVAQLVAQKAQQRHVTGRYAIAGHPAETRLLPSGKRAVPLHRAIQQQTDQEDDDAANS